ncbi:MAG: ATP-binding protein [Chloroflexota bacterium]
MNNHLLLFGLNWALVAFSLTNTILLLWLGLTVLLNAEHRTGGVWMSSLGMLVAGLFFISHTAILGHGLTSLDSGMNFWWDLGLMAVIALPFVWYVVVLWYAGFWDDPQSVLHRRHQFWLVLDTMLTFFLVGLLIFANPFPSYVQVITLQLSSTPNLAGVPLLLIGYPLCTLISIGFSVDALWRPGPSRRMMGQLARQRARPWMIATSAVLLLVALLIALVMLWVVLNESRLIMEGVTGSTEITISWLDLLISSCITFAIIFLGQAIVRYEVFTGKTLPRRRFMRHWRNVVILAVSYGSVMSAGLALGLHPIYSLLVMALLMTFGYAWFSQSSYRERERYIQHLRPFVLSQQLYDHLITNTAPGEVDVARPFQALCGEVLGAKLAYLAALGPLAPFVGPTLTYSIDGASPPVPVPITDLNLRFDSPQTMCIALNPTHYGGALWAVPLWSERGLIGVLLLGAKVNGGLYTQEEIEIARASGERLIDTKASAEMARRLMDLQRQRLTENNIVDHRTRRMLHDDILPRIHAAMLTLSAKQAQSEETVQTLADIHHQIADLLHEMPIGVAPEIAQIGLIKSLERVIEKEWPGAFDEVTWQIDPAAACELPSLPALTAEVVYYAAREAIRNAARHGRGTQLNRPLCLCVQISCADALQLVVEDNGVGLNTLDRPRSDGGNGLALHSTMMAVVGGTLALQGSAGQGTRVCLTVFNHA